MLGRDKTRQDAILAGLNKLARVAIQPEMIGDRNMDYSEFKQKVEGYKQIEVDTTEFGYIEITEDQAYRIFFKYEEKVKFVDYGKSKEYAILYISE